MIAKSDLIILTISSLALVAGVYRWQQNVAVPRVAATPSAPVRVIERVPQEPVDSARNAAATIVGTLTDNADGSARSVADSSLTIRRSGAGEASGDGRASGAPDIATTRTDALEPSVDTNGTADVATAAESPDRSLYGVYRVRSGDYLGKIANQFGTSVETLQRINDLDGTLIEVGKEIRYPQPAN